MRPTIGCSAAGRSTTCYAARRRTAGVARGCRQKGDALCRRGQPPDDHIVNIILDVSSTGILTVQREGLDQELPAQFSLVGTMNPEEGGLRPQLLDRFGLMVDVGVETDVAVRAEILRTVLMLDEALAQPTSDFLERGREEDRPSSATRRGPDRLYDVKVRPEVASLCAAVAARFQSAGHRGDIVMALAARALAAYEGTEPVVPPTLPVSPDWRSHRRHELVGVAPATGPTRTTGRCRSSSLPAMDVATTIPRGLTLRGRRHVARRSPDSTGCCCSTCLQPRCRRWPSPSARR